jgi:hypothetical protein
MADSKISALPAATTPLAGTEVLPIVQGGTTDKVSVADLTAGRAVSADSISLTTNIKIGGDTLRQFQSNGIIGVLTTKTFTFSSTNANDAGFVEICISAVVSTLGFSTGKFLVAGQIGSANSTNYNVVELTRSNNNGSLGVAYCQLSAITKANGSFSFTLQNLSGGAVITYVMSVNTAGFSGQAGAVTLTIT